MITFFTHDGILSILGYCGVTFENILSKPMLFLLLNPTEALSLIIHYVQSPAVLIIIMRLVWILISILLVFGIYKYLRREGMKPLFLLAVTIVAYFATTTSINGLGVNARFRVPIEVFIFCFAVYGFFVIKEYIHLKRIKHEAVHSHTLLQ